MTMSTATEKKIGTSKSFEQYTGTIITLRFKSILVAMYTILLPLNNFKWKIKTKPTHASYMFFTTIYVSTSELITAIFMEKACLSICWWPIISKKIGWCTCYKNKLHYYYPNIVIRVLYPLLLMVFIIFGTFVQDNMSKFISLVKQLMSVFMKKDRHLSYVHEHLLCQQSLDWLLFVMIKTKQHLCVHSLLLTWLE